MTITKIAVDYDDVIIPFIQSFFDWYHAKYGELHSADSFKEWTRMSDFYGYDNQYWTDRMNEYHSSGLSASHDPIDGAIDVLRGLSDDHDIVILTSRPARHRKHLEAWIDRHATGVIDELHMYEGNQHKPTTGHEKGAHCLEIGAKYLIDDNPSYIASANRHGVKGILFGNHSWNEHAREQHLHAPDWPSVELIIRG